jgi:NAD(P)-dependent dehydrogenase (short-subunit alcohol dehydrogenase family)
LTLKNKVALITGATQGIGLAIARALADEGCHLALCGRNEHELQRSQKQLAGKGVKVLAMACDVRDEQSVSDLFKAVCERFGRLDILINNAGIAHADLPVAKLPAQDWSDVIATNLTGMFLVTKAALPLIKRGGIIVNNLSVAAKQVFPNSAAYNASKHGALGFTNSLREELREKGIRVTALLPGATDTAIWNTFWPDAPRKRMMRADAVAQAVVAALKLPPESSVDEISITPAAGAL